MAEGAWQPLLHGAVAERARLAVRELGAVLRDGAGVQRGDHGEAAARALFFAYASDAVGEGAGFEDEAGRWLELAADWLAVNPGPMILHTGALGTAWVVEHLAGADEDEPDPLAPMDARLTRWLSEAWTGDYDLIRGLVGLGVYGLERAHRRGGRDVVAAVIDALERSARRQDGGVTWHTAPDHLPSWQRALAPDGYYNLGLAHGVPGVIGLLARCVALDLCADRAEALLVGAVSWLLAQRRPADEGSWFAGWVGAPEQSRAAWCYGDPGVAASIAVAAAATGREEWRELARALAVAIATRSVELCGVRDGCLCHGALGLAHVLARLYQVTAAAPAREGAVAWYERGLALRRDRREGISGWLSFLPDELPGPDGTAYKPDSSLITGASGIGLALAAALAEASPDWDRVMLLDIPA